MIHAADIQAIVFDGSGPLLQPLANWIAHVPGPWLASKVLPGFADCPRGTVASPGFIARMRNVAWQLFLTSSTRSWLLMLDDDVIPVAETEPLFATDYPHPVMGAQYFGKAGTPVHPEDGYVGCGCLLVNRVAAEMIGPDPFSIVTGEGCECVAFCRRAHAAGFWPAKRGAVGHRCLVDVLPAGGDTYRIRFPTAEALSRHSPKPPVAHFDKGGHLLDGPPELRARLAAQCRGLPHGGLVLGGGIVTQKTFA
jgi:hypothetical protein